MSPIPRDRTVDSTFALLSQGYAFFSDRCRRYGSDVFETRIMLKRAVCVQGEDGARMFYHPGRFTRQGALPVTTLKLLQDRGSVQAMDGEAHRWRKQMFMSLMTPDSLRRIADLVAEGWQARLGDWRAADRVTLFPEAQTILCQAVCTWTGISLPADQLAQRTRELAAMIDGAGAVGPRNWKGMILRSRTEQWAQDLVERVRKGQLHAAPDSPLHVIASHREMNGEPLDATIAGVELINLLRPTVAIANYIIFAALALHEYPEWRSRLQAAGDDELEMFEREVRRFYPFFPAVAGRVRVPFMWRGHHFAAGRWVLLDIYGTNHDPRIWDQPDEFRPERFRDWNGNPFTLIPQGGGDHYADHRCAGEWITVEIMKRAIRLLTSGMSYDVPEQDLHFSLSRLPALPKSRFVISNVKPL